MSRKNKRLFIVICTGAILFAGITNMTVRATSSDEKKICPLYQTYCKEIGQAYQICPELIEAIIEAESGGDAGATGSGGDIGLMQIVPQWHKVRAEHLKVYDLTDPYGNILVGTDYLYTLIIKYGGEVAPALMEYHGERDVEERIRRGEISEYALKILNRARELEEERDAKQSAVVG